MVWRRRKRNYPATLPTKLTTTATVSTIANTSL